jgi:hypothetical protein
MRAIPFAVLMKAYPRKRDLDHDALFRLLGWDDLIANPAYANTCAVRVSLALIRSGVHVPDGRLTIRAGTHKGKMIEPGQARLSAILSRSSMLGQAEKFGSGPAMYDGIRQRSGIVSFFHLIPGVYEGGHIDIVSPQLGGPGALACGTDCYWTSKEVWFWPLA